MPCQRAIPLRCPFLETDTAIDICGVAHKAQASQPYKVEVLFNVQLYAEGLGVLRVMIGILQAGTSLVVRLLDRILEVLVETADRDHLARGGIELITKINIVSVSVLQLRITHDVCVSLEVEVHVRHYLSELRTVDRATVSGADQMFCERL